jgi:hypothetical protein
MNSIQYIILILYTVTVVSGGSSGSYFGNFAEFITTSRAGLAVGVIRVYYLYGCTANGNEQCFEKGTSLSQALIAAWFFFGISKKSAVQPQRHHTRDSASLNLTRASQKNEKMNSTKNAQIIPTKV